MLPILRIIPVGGVLLAVMIVVLALEPPGSPPPALTRSRAPLVVAEDHPEWRQFLIQAAVRRADEVSRLRDLPSTPTRVASAPEPEKASTGGEPEMQKVAGLPTSRGDSDPDDQTSTITEAPSATIPVDIGETSRFELPVSAPEEKLPPVKPQLKPPSESRSKPAEAHKTVKKPQRTVKRARPAARPQTAQQSDPFAAIFGGDQRYQSPGPQTAPRSTASQNQ